MKLFSKYLRNRYFNSGLFCFALIFCFNLAYTQTAKRISYLYQEELQKGDEYYALHNYKSAIELYRQVLRKAGEDTVIICKIADSYRLMNDPTSAEEWYRRIIVNDSLKNPIYKLYFAQILTINGKHDEALFWYKEYYKTADSDIRAIEAIKSIENISNFYYDTTFYLVYPISVNTQYAEFSPLYYKDGILFLSDRNGGFLSWYIASADTLGNFSKPIKYNLDIKTGYNQGPLSFYDNYKKMVYSQNYSAEKPDKNKINEIPLQLFYAEKDDRGKWKEPQLLSINNKNYSFSQPSVTTDGNVLYFSSNTPGGYGGADIYMSKFENGSWNSSVNLGDKINSPGDEMFPYIFQDSVLFFSSNGLGGLGGFDIFKINLNNNEKIIKNMGIPINSSNDDFGIVLDSGALSGYFASNRLNGIGNDDIYGFSIVRITFTIKLIDENTTLPVSNAEIYSVDTINEKKIGVTDGDGSCTLVLPVCKVFNIKIKKDNYESKIYTFEPIKNSHNTLAVIPIKAAKIQTGEETIILTDENNKLIENPQHVVYKVQIMASRVAVSAQQQHKKYQGSLIINNFYEDGWYKYSIGEYSSYTEAKQSLYSCGVYDAFIIAYVDNKKVHITIAKAVTNENNVKSPARRIELLNH